VKKPKSADQVVGEIVARDRRYSRDAYQFIMEALERTYRSVHKRRHVTGRELLDGARVWAIERYGPMAKLVLAHWGVHSCEDLGEIVFNLVESGVLNKTERDSRDDFKDGYDFTEVFGGAE
jgi:uncharacterized repeat protein (TIGR04138 family)